MRFRFGREPVEMGNVGSNTEPRVGGSNGFIVGAGKYVICATTAEGDSKVIEDGAVFQRDGEIVDVGPYGDLKGRHEADEEIGSTHHVVLPGLVNAHHHVGLTPFQLGAIDPSFELWFGARGGEKQADKYLETLWCATEMIESGITTVNHMHNPSQGPRRPGGTNADVMFEEARQVIRAYDDSGMRVAFSQPMWDQNRLAYDDEAFLKTLPTDLEERARRWRDGADIAHQDYLKLNSDLIRDYGQKRSERVRILLFPVNVQWCSDSLLMSSKEFANRHNTGIHIHLVETMYQKQYGLRTFGKTPLAHLYDLGFLGPEVSIDHGVWLTEGDIELMAETGIMLTHQPSSNFRLMSGMAPLNRLLAKGVTVALGIDEAGINDDNDILQEMRLAMKIHRVPGIDQVGPTSGQILHLTTVGGAKTTLFGDRIGSIEKGKGADLVLMDLERLSKPYLDAGLSIVDVVLYRGKMIDVDTVMIAGEVVYKDRRFTRLDKDDIVAQLAESLARELTAAELERARMGKELIPYVRRFYQGWEMAEQQPHSVYNSAV